MKTAIAAALGFAIAAAAQPSFEVASVKPAAPTTGHFQYHMTLKVYPGRVDIQNASFVDLIRTAYRVKADQVSGPPWMVTEKFDIVAKLAEGASQDQVPEMLQALLASRFKLAVHRTSKEMAAYALIVAKGGPKLQPSKPASDATRPAWSRQFDADGTMHMNTVDMSLPALADLMSSFLDRPVVDMTGLQGTYDVPLDFSPDEIKTGSDKAGVAAPPAPDGNSGSLIFTSMQNVGLKLDARKLPLDVISVDHLEKTPTGN